MSNYGIAISKYKLSYAELSRAFQKQGFPKRD
jgi:hypothetical protein